jgi:pyruvate dehydrogenase (quinone)
MAQTVADTLVGVLERIGVKQIFALIGDSLNPLADSPRSSSIDWIGVRHEEGAALAASGQAKLTGRLAVCAGAAGPGSTHLVAGLYEAARDHAPVLALSGNMPRNMQGVDYIQTTNPDLLFRNVSLYTESINSPEQAPAVIHQAIAAAYAGRGVAHLTLPLDVILAGTNGDVASMDTLRTRPGDRGERGGCSPHREPDRRGRQRSHNVRGRLPWGRDGAARPVRPSQGAADPFRQGPGHHAL